MKDTIIEDLSEFGKAKACRARRQQLKHSVRSAVETSATKGNPMPCGIEQSGALATEPGWRVGKN